MAQESQAALFRLLYAGLALGTLFVLTPTVEVKL